MCVCLWFGCGRGRGVRVLRGLDGIQELTQPTILTSASAELSTHLTTNITSSSSKGETHVTTSLRVSGAPKVVPPSSMAASASGGARNGIVQRYIEEPLLVDGYKFDIRCYLLVARNDPTYLAYYHSGYCRLTLEKYDLSSSLEDPLVHLTNAAIQKKHPMYDKLKENQVHSK